MKRIYGYPTAIAIVLTTGLLFTMFSGAQEAKKEEGKDKEDKKPAAAKQDAKPATSTSTTPATTEKPAAAETSSKSTPAETPKPDAAKSAASPSTPPTPKAVAVTRGLLKVDLTLSGNLEATAMTEVSIAPKQWTQLVVTEATPAGTQVTKGQTLLKLDTTKIDDAIRELEASRALGELAFRQAVENFKLQEKQVNLDAQLAERTKKIAEQDYDLYVKVDAPQAKKSADFQLKASEQNLEYVTEELKQLEKMYKADDLTEETEEIILKRARNDVDRAKYSTDLARSRYERTTTVEFPRTAEQQKFTLDAAILAYEKARLNIPIQHMRQKLEVDKMQADLKKSEEKLNELKRDREMLTVTAPADGILFYGRSQNGKWVSASSIAQKLRRGGTITPHEILFTVVSEGNWLVRSTVTEKDIANVKPGLAGRMKVAAYPKQLVQVKVRDVGAVPNPEGSYDVTLELLERPESRLVAGMSAEVKLTLYANADAISVPSSAVFSEENDETKQYVYVANAEGKPEKRTVVTGQVSGDKTEIVSGLSASDKIFPQKPNES